MVEGRVDLSCVSPEYALTSTGRVASVDERLLDGLSRAGRGADLGEPLIWRIAVVRYAAAVSSATDSRRWFGWCEGLAADTIGDAWVGDNSRDHPCRGREDDGRVLGRVSDSMTRAGFGSAQLRVMQETA